jgi:hypothetical protein
VNLFLRSVTANEAASPAEQTALLSRSSAFKAILAEQTAVGSNATSSAPQTPDLAGSVTGQTHLLHKFILLKQHILISRYSV